MPYCSNCDCDVDCTDCDSYTEKEVDSELLMQNIIKLIEENSYLKDAYQKMPAINQRFLMDDIETKIDTAIEEAN